MADTPLLDVPLTYNLQTGTTYTLQLSDNNKIVIFSSASSVTLTLPNSLTVGFNCILLQKGAGQVTLSPAAGATLNNRLSFTKLAGQHATGSLIVTDNSNGSLAVYNFGGDGA